MRPIRMAVSSRRVQPVSPQLLRYSTVTLRVSYLKTRRSVGSKSVWAINSSLREGTKVLDPVTQQGVDLDDKVFVPLQKRESHVVFERRMPHGYAANPVSNRSSLRGDRVGKKAVLFVVYQKRLPLSIYNFNVSSFDNRDGVDIPQAFQERRVCL